MKPKEGRNNNQSVGLLDYVRFFFFFLEKKSIQDRFGYGAQVGRVKLCESLPFNYQKKASAMRVREILNKSIQFYPLIIIKSVELLSFVFFLGVF